MRDAQNLGFKKGRLLYYVLLNPWMNVSKHDIWLRSLSVIFALASVYAIYQLAQQLFNQKTALLSSFFLSISPLFINHAQEVRYYTMSLFFGIIGAIFFCQYIHQDNMEKQNISKYTWIVARVLACFTTPLNLVFILSDFFIFILYFITRKRRLTYRNLSKLALDYLLIGLAIFPVFVSVYIDLNSHKLTPPIPGLIDVLRQVRILTVYAHPPSSKLTALLLQFIVLMILVIWAFSLWQSRNRKYIIPIAIWAFLPILIVFVFSHAFYSIWISRYIMSSLPYFLILLSLGLIELAKKFRILAMVMLGVYLFSSGVGLIKYYNTKNRYIGAFDDRYRDVAHYICSDGHRGDMLVWSIVHEMTLPFTHYCDRDLLIYPKNLPDKSSDSKELATWVDSIPTTNAPFWLVYGQKSKLLLESLQKKFTIEEHKKFDEFSVFVLQNKQ
ncbi:glycosyltransferase family 39 protein [Spirulina sp. 06S082]|uniref:glycosyltransferase family 39 protein n=1 Tax=Spirulina sp. 06S082 TaxID=3110248 RepID=UPI002B1EE859|nr:glycosyltransferase family 39 protein [Spirulina sp. 06S082]MEA5469139.1 glycosyltransferase family 39 protein [Spirulina sp. 06S082]